MKHEHLISEIRSGSIAEEMGIEPGDKLLTVNGNIIEVGKVNKNEPKRIQFTLKESENWALEVKVYEN